MVARVTGQVPSVAPGVADTLEALPVPAVMLDRRGRILALNAAWDTAATPGGLMATTDRRGDDYVRSLETTRGFAHTTASQLASLIRAVLEGEREEGSIEYRVDGTAWHAVVRRGDGSAFAVIVSHVDRTAQAQLREAEERLASVHVEHQALQAWRDDHLERLATALQALHGPATPVRIHLHQLLHGPGRLSKKQRAALEAMQRSVERWCDMQDALFDEANASSSGVVDVRTLVTGLRRSCGDLALRLGVSIEEEVSVDGEIEVDSMLRQALLLLMGHAVRACPAGGTARLRAQPHMADLELIFEDDDPAGAEAAAWPGLRFCQMVLARRGGSMMAAARDDGSGLRVVVRIPTV